MRVVVIRIIKQRGNKIKKLKINKQEMCLQENILKKCKKFNLKNKKKNLNQFQ